MKMVLMVITLALIAGGCTEGDTSEHGDTEILVDRLCTDSSTEEYCADGFEEHLIREEIRAWMYETIGHYRFVAFKGDSLVRACEPYRASHEKISKLTGIAEAALDTLVRFETFRDDDLHMFVDSTMSGERLIRQSIRMERALENALVLRAQLEGALEKAERQGDCQMVATTIWEY